MIKSVVFHDLGDFSFPYENLGGLFKVISDSTAMPLRIFLGKGHHALFV